MGSGSDLSKSVSSQLIRFWFCLEQSDTDSLFSESVSDLLLLLLLLFATLVDVGSKSISKSCILQAL